MSTIRHPAHPALLRAMDIANALLPKTRWADNWWLRTKFYIEHGRRLTNRNRYNDYVMRHLMSEAIDDPLVAATTCKARAKSYLAEHIDARHIVPTLAVLETSAELDAYDFPDTCIIKGTAASGQVVLRENAGAVPRDKIKRWFRHNHYDFTRERIYKPLKNHVIVEPVIAGAGLADDIKLVTFDGTVRLVYHQRRVEHGRTRQLLDRDWKPLNVGKKYEVPNESASRPKHWADMVAAAERLAAPFKLVRIDFYASGDDWWVGELTHSESAGATSFIPLEGEEIVNKLVFGDDAYAGPFETHGALGAKGPPATFAEIEQG